MQQHRQADIGFRRQRETVHHLYPVSRGPYQGNNTVSIDKVLHYAWHAAFEDAIPEEVLQDLLDVWWHDNHVTVTVVIGSVERDFVRRCQRAPRTATAASGFEIVFPNNRPLEILKLWLWRWVPDDYFTEVHFHAPGLTYVMDAYTVDHDLLSRVNAQQRILLHEAYRRWSSVGHWDRRGAHQEFITRICG